MTEYLPVTPRRGLEMDAKGDWVMTAPFHAPMEPVYPCRVLSTRHCPAVYDAVCGDRPCARYESEDETPWLPEVGL